MLILSNYENSDVRAKRLQRVVHHIEARGGLPPEVRRLHDHKGILHVYWSRRPDDLDAVRRIYAAWASECECAVSHCFSFSGEVFLEDNGGGETAAQHLFRRIEYVIK